MALRDLDWAEFLHTMEEARFLLDGGQKGDAPRTPPGWMATVVAVKAAHDLLRGAGRDDLAALFFLLLAALKDIEHGQSPALLTPVYRVKGDESWLANNKGITARAIDELMRDGIELDAAVKVVWEAARRNIPGLRLGTVRNWRYELRKSDADPEAPAAKRYHAPFPPGIGDDPHRRATYLLLQLTAAPPALRNPRSRK